MPRTKTNTPDLMRFFESMKLNRTDEIKWFSFIYKLRKVIVRYEQYQLFLFAIHEQQSRGFLKPILSS